MTWKSIETSREIRLWVTQIMVPAIVTAGVALSVPEVRQTVKEKATVIKQKIKARKES